MGNGTIASPWTLPQSLTSGDISTGDTVYLRDGVYAYDSILSLPANTIWRPYENEKPIITRTDGTAPKIHVGAGTRVENIWFGGARGNANSGLTLGGNVQLLGNTFFGFYGVVAEGGNVANVYRNNRFVNNGSGTFYHSVYISNFNATQEQGAVIDGNIFIGGEGYHIHLWHEPRYVTITSNFSASGFYEAVLHGIGHVAQDNVFWNHAPPAGLTVNLADPSDYQFIHNLFGPRTFGTGKWPQDINGETGKMVDGCGFIGDEYLDSETWPGQNIWVGPYSEVRPKAPGSNYIRYALGDVPGLLGYSVTEIDAACDALEASFQQSAGDIHADATIEANFAILASVIAAWRGAAA